MSFRTKSQIAKVFNDEIKRMQRVRMIALNRAGRSALAQTVMFIRKAYNIKSSDLKNEIKIKAATRTRDRFRLTVTHKAIALVKYGSARQTRTGVSATISKGKRQQFKSAFIATVGKGSHTGVFKRKGKARLPIKELYGPSAEQLMSSKQAEEFIQRVFRERLEVELKRAIEYAK